MILADTHAWLWWVTGDKRVSPSANGAMNRQPVAISAISMWEVAQLAAKGRIQLDTDALEWLEEAIDRADDRPETAVLDLTPAICATGAAFGPRLHRDPSDRLIVATALLHGIALVTADQAITASGLVRTIW